MKSEARSYRQTARAADAEERTERILGSALELFVERPFEQVTLAAVADRAAVGLQTVIRRVGTKDGLVQAVTAWVGPQVARDRGEPSSSDPATVAVAIARHYAKWAVVTERTVTQSESSPALAANAESGRQAHRAWIGAAFAAELDALPATQRRRLHARLVAVCGVEIWLVLTRAEGLSITEARDAVADLIAACLAAARTSHHTELELPQ